MGHKVTGVDISKTGVKTLMNNAKKLGVQDNITPVLGDIKTGEVPRIGYDSAISHCTLHVLSKEDRARAIGFMQKTTKPGGTHIITGLSSEDTQFPMDQRSRLFSVDEMRGLYSKGWDILRLEDGQMGRRHTHKDGSTHIGHRIVVLIAKKQKDYLLGSKSDELKTL